MSPNIYIDHQRTIFEEHTKIIGIKRPTQDPRCSDYKLQSQTNCEDISEIINAWQIDNNSITINSSDLLKYNSQELVYFNISSKDNQDDICGYKRTIFQIKQQGQLIFKCILPD